ncbi:nucleotide-binding universal stress UspA family protein [Streptosporangium album]|uniref:Nucleotide-binding universal stress UspA family protein n=1 Tax=Streptosporangium album TaxID=47479 RepID=A0A7W7WBD1_9ACTN|nr:universal stress protein [Streptosporangium album]MBB4941382.1 nucleotide-binding universal stress UspA family protein [Streptosporangium album]
MKIEHVLAGFVPESRGKDGLALAVLLARQTGARLTVAYVHTPAWTTPGPGRIDAEWRAYVTAEAARTLEQARLLLADVRDLPIDYVLDGNRGSGRGLVQLAGRTRADVVVIGPAPGGVRGRIRLGSTADQLLHASPVPVALAPRGYGGEHPPEIRRLTVAYRRDPASDQAVLEAATLAARMGVPLRLITLVVHSGQQARMDEETLNRLRETVTADLRAAARGHGRLEVAVEVLEGRNVATALGGTDCEGVMLICASSETGPLRRVFVGDISSKIIRSASCPVMMLPRNPPKKPGIIGKQGKL